MFFIFTIYYFSVRCSYFIFTRFTTKLQSPCSCFWTLVWIKGPFAAMCTSIFSTSFALPRAVPALVGAPPSYLFEEPNRRFSFAEVMSTRSVTASQISAEKRGEGDGSGDKDLPLRDPSCTRSLIRHLAIFSWFSAWALTDEPKQH